MTIKTMKLALKVFLIGAAITTGIGACSGDGSKATADSSSVDSNVTVSTSTDTSITIDSAKRDTNSVFVDSPATKVDTLKKTVTKKTVIKKTVTKKDSL